jgi:lambda repressor-like predicted transcriptional regulator
MRIDRAKFCAELARRSWTLKKLSEESGVSRQTLSYIKGGKNCTDEVGNKIANALKMEVDELLEDY